MAKNINDSIRAALTELISSVDARGLLAKANEERARLEAAVTAARRAALDPLATQDAAVASRQQLERLTFDRDRLDSQIAALERRISELVDEESAAAAERAYQAAKAERDELAATIADRYPKLVAEFIDLARRVRASDEALAVVNSGVASDAWLLGAEAAARGLDGLHRHRGIAAARLTENVIAGFEPSTQPEYCPRLGKL